MRKLFVIAALALFAAQAFGQSAATEIDVQPGRFDQGRMWTFENPPVKYLTETYKFTPDAAWLEDARKSALRFASWCSASFISENGLIMTNHHCSRSVTASVMKEGENFDADGFYAVTTEEERRVPNLYVDQLVRVEDVTKAVQERVKQTEAAEVLKALKSEYEQKPEWKDLVIETRTFYSGGRYSMYGFKRYKDVRLVLYPELAMGYFGGDPDNFTYPRYNLDFTFFRAYDEEGKPLKPDHYFEFNPEGADENETVFVIGNPGSTGRYLTMAQLYFQRDVMVPTTLSYLGDRKEILLKSAETVKDVYKKDSITNIAFSLSNSEKAYAGRLQGLHDKELMARKVAKEKQVRSNSVLREGSDPWESIAANMVAIGQIYPDMLLLQPNAYRGKVNLIIHELSKYQAAVGKNDTLATRSEKEIRKTLAGFNTELERALFAAQLQELRQHSKTNFVQPVLGGKNPYDKAASLMEESILLNDPDKFFKLKESRLDKEPLMALAPVWSSKYKEATDKYAKLSKENTAYQEKIANIQFSLSGVDSPPDATFSLRLSDGIVKGYEYNGTEAPYKTTYYGLYDRYFSNNGKFPWNLPSRWENPTSDLLKAPLNFVCTADIIGGNSGSPVINTKQQIVGLVFDGNMESLPGYFIFDDTLNRTVAVHAGGIVAAVKYIYKADRLLKELNAK